MKIRLIGDNNYHGDIQAEYFKNRDIVDVELFKNIHRYEPTHYSEFVNMDKAVELLGKHLKNKSKVGIIADNDCDGMTSASLIYRFLKNNFGDKLKSVDYLIHNENKTHGIFLNEIEEKGWMEGEDKIDLLIVPDAGSENHIEMKTLYAIGIDSLIIDHHSVQNLNIDYAVVVNNQFNTVSPHLTGVGMVMKFIEAIVDKTKKEIPDSYYNLVAMGLIGDSADSTNLDVQYYIQKGLKNITNKFINALSEQVSFSTKGVIDQESMGWYLVPLVNGAIRYGNKEEREMLFEAFAEINDSRVFEYTYQRGQNKGSTIEETLYQSVCRMSSGLKAKQDREIEKIIEGNTKVKGLIDFIEDNDTKKLLAIDLTEYVSDGSLTGVIANKLSSRYRKPILALRKLNDGQYGGSARGDKISHFKDKLNKSMILSGNGHQSAFGIAKFQLGEKTLKDIESELNAYFKNEDIDSNYEVDFIIPIDELEDTMIEDLHSIKEFFGHGMSAPLIYFENVKIKTNEIKTNDKMTVFSFDKNYVSFVKFKMTKEKYEELVDWSDTMCYNIVGKPFVKVENGSRKVGIVIQDIEVVKSESEDDNDGWEDTVLDTNEWEDKSDEVKVNTVDDDWDEW